VAPHPALPCAKIIRSGAGRHRAGREDLKAYSLILLQLEIPLETVYATIEFGKWHGIKTLLNPAPATSDLDLRRILHVSFSVPNETELALLSRHPVGTGPQIEAAARSLIAGGIGTVIVTMGERGACS